MKRRRIEIHIEEIVLRGVAPGERGAIVRGLRDELGRLFAAGGLPLSMRDGDVSKLQGTLDTDAPVSGVALGREAARSIYKGARR